MFEARSDEGGKSESSSEARQGNPSRSPATNFRKNVSFAIKLKVVALPGMEGRRR